MTTQLHEALLTITAENCFQVRLEGFLKDLLVEEKVKTEIRREVVKLMLTIQKGMGANKLTAISREHDFFDDFKFFKKQYLDVSAYMHRVLWREIVYFIKEQNYRIKHEALNSDILYAIKFLHNDDIERIMLLKINYNLNASLDLNNFSTGKVVKRNLQAYAKSKTGSLKYLTKYDAGNTKDDFNQDIIEELVRVNNAYNKSSGKNLSSEDNIENAIQKYLETSLNNKVNQIKDYWGSNIRSRVSSTHSDLYKSKETLEKKLKTFEVGSPDHKKTEMALLAVKRELKEGSSDYYSVVVPLVRTNESENREVDAQEVDPTIITDDNSEDTYWSKKLLDDLEQQDITPRISKCVNILLGNYDSGFIEWSKTSKKKYNLDILDHLSKAAMEYCKVTKNELRNNPTLIRALQTAPATRKHFKMEESSLLVQNLTTKKIYTARVEDTRTDGSMIFKIDSNKDDKYFDTNDIAFDKKWKIVNVEL